MLWLSRFVEEVRVLGPALRVERLPDGRTTFVFREMTDDADVTIAGPRTRALFKTTHDVVRGVIVQFKPGWTAALLGVDASALTDRYVALDDLWGRTDLCQQLVAARSIPEVLARISDAFARRTPDEPAAARLARRAAHLIEAGEVRVQSVAEQLGVSPRHLRRAFLENIGVGPKEFARNVRLQRAVRMTETTTDLGRIAAATGYYDQAHLSADFRELVGLTPGAFLKRNSAVSMCRTPGETRSATP